MTANIKLEASIRKEGENTKELTKEGLVPAVIYGPQMKANKIVKIQANQLNKVFAAAGESTLIDLVVDGKAEGKVLIKESQRDAVKNNIIHVDLYEVDMNKEIHVDVPLKFVGVAPAIEAEGGVLVESIYEVEVKCLPSNLISHIDVDLSVLAHMHDVIKMHDLKLPAGVKLTSETDDVVATVTEVKVVKEEPVAAPVAAEVAAPVAAEKTEAK
jgi:large subunit ribosomal protein L25